MSKKTPRALMVKRWETMQRYCTDPRYKTYEYVGALGIRVCDRWVNSFEDYLADVGYPPAPKLFLERIDKSKNFEPGNVRWVTKTELVNNTALVVKITYRGQVLNIAQAAALVGLSDSVVSTRLKFGWSVERALETPTDDYESRTIHYNGRDYSVSELAAETGLTVASLYARVFKLKWSIDRAVTTPLPFRRENKNIRSYEFNGRTLNIKEWSKVLDIPVSTLNARLAKCGYDPNTAFTKPRAAAKSPGRNDWRPDAVTCS